MKLWIRSQDRVNLKIVSDIMVLKNGEILCSGESFGKYKNKQRALEVLDDIQDLLMGDLENHINKFDIYNGDNIKVYNMPKE